MIDNENSIDTTTTTNTATSDDVVDDLTKCNSSSKNNIVTTVKNNLSRASSFNNKNGLIENTNKIQAIVFTNTDDIDNLNAICNDTNESPAILYENDFDLYSLLKEMILKNPNKNNVNDDNKQLTSTPTAELSYNNEQMSQAKKKVIFKNYKKLLTAQLNDISYTDGEARWALQTNFNLMYSKNINCIGTNVADFEHSEPIFLDLQPLSTRIKLMCKLVIIIQGACVERFGPPKLVQDRCFQFDGDHDLKQKDAQGLLLRADSNSSLNLNKIKSNSCENLLFETTTSTSTTTTTTTSIKTEDALLVSNTTTNNENIVYKRKRKDSAPNILEKAVDDEVKNDAKNYSKKHYDLENYYRHRMSRYSLKDYASLPYYQYSRRVVKRLDKGVNTDESFLNNLAIEKENKETKNENCEVEEKVKNFVETINVVEKTSEIKNDEINTSNNKINKKDSCTCTDDLIDGFYMGYFSKSQLLSSYSLFNTKSTLWNSFTNTEHPYEDNNTTNNNNNNKTTKTEYYYSYSKEYYVTTKGGEPPPPPVHVSGLTIQTNDLSSIRQRPQRSSNWSLFNRGPERSSTSEPLEISVPLKSGNITQVRFFPSNRYIQRPPPIPPRASATAPKPFRAAKF